MAIKDQIEIVADNIEHIARQAHTARGPQDRAAHWLTVLAGDLRTLSRDLDAFDRGRNQNVLKLPTELDNV